MKSVGVVVEYNPFHNGHKYHAASAKEKTEADVVIAVMSGNFLQRGEPALFNKWIRTEAALKNGVDIVLELPVLYSNQSAEIFAYGAVSILDSVGCSNIVFGSETKSINELKEIVEIENNNELKEKLDTIVKEELKKGLSYPNAYNNAILKLSGKNDVLTPNNILGIEYMRALKKINSKMEPELVKRKGAEFYSETVSENIASATLIRKKIESGNINEIISLIPENSVDLLKKEYESSKMVKLDDFFDILKYVILSQPEKLKYIQDIESGFDIRLYKGALKSKNYNEFFESIITKRYTISRVQRMLTHIILDIDVESSERIKRSKPPYSRILGVNNVGREYLKYLKKRDPEIFLMTNTKCSEEKLSALGNFIYEYDKRATEIYKILSYYEERKMPILVE